jgi:kanamycin kinase
VTFPSSHPPVPTVVRRFADGRPVRAVWVNDEGGVTFRLGAGGSGRDFVKVANARGTDFAAEARRLRWAARYLTVCAIGAGLRALHDRLPERTCPFEWSAASPLAALTPAARARLGEPPPVDRLVVCHGDACAPNTLIDDEGRCCGHVDFGELGVADRWADLAVATLSLGWNYPGRGWEAEFFAAYGVEPDPARIDYYRRLWQASDGTSR